MQSCGRFILTGMLMGLTVLAAGPLPSHAADLEMQVVDKNCWIEIFEDDNFDADDPHVKLYGPKEFATMKNVEGKDWSNDIESVIVGSNATVRAYEDKDFKGTEIAFAPGQRVLRLGNGGVGDEDCMRQVASLMPPRRSSFRAGLISHPRRSTPSSLSLLISP